MFKELIQYYLDEFQRRGEAAVVDICNLSVPSRIILEKYKTLAPIEEMEEKEKKEMKQYIIEIFPNKTIQEKLNCCKIFYTIGTLA